MDIRTHAPKLWFSLPCLLRRCLFWGPGRGFRSLREQRCRGATAKKTQRGRYKEPSRKAAPRGQTLHHGRRAVLEATLATPFSIFKNHVNANGHGRPPDQPVYGDTLRVQIKTPIAAFAQHNIG